MIRTAIVDEPIDPAAVLAEVAAPGNGAAVLFIGTVRDVNLGRPVTGMEYAAYRAMAERELEAVAVEASDRFRVGEITVVHRIGVLEIGEASVAIAVGHAHRGEAFDAAREIIEELKRRVPIWKREHYTDGSREWVDPTGASAPVPVAVAQHGAQDGAHEGADGA